MNGDNNENPEYIIDESAVESLAPIENPLEGLQAGAEAIPGMPGDMPAADDSLLATGMEGIPAGDEAPLLSPEDASQSTHLSAEELLTEALPESELTASLAEEKKAEPTESAEGPFFLLTLKRALQAEEKTALEKLLKENGLPQELSGKKIFPKLQEWQAAQIASFLFQAGIPFHSAVEAFALPEENDFQTEAAPSVILADTSQGVLLCTAENLPSWNILETKGFVVTHRSLARRLFREEELEQKLQKELAAMGKNQRFRGKLERLLEEMGLDLQKQALALGANAVIGIKLQSYPEMEHLDSDLDQMRLVALGTAAVVQK